MIRTGWSSVGRSVDLLVYWLVVLLVVLRKRMTSDRDWLVLSWSGTGQLAGAVAALPGTTCVFATNNNESIVFILITNKQTKNQTR